MGSLRLPTPISGGLILSYQCMAECRHCMYGCSPRWRDWISEEELERLLGRLAGKIEPAPYGPESVGLNHGLHFTGGEPFLDFDLLLKGTEIARELGIPSTFVETNCFWCTRDDTTRDKLEQLRAAGLRGIMISVNPYYLEFVPFERTERGIRIAREVFEENAMIYQWDYYLAFRKLAIRGKLPLEAYLERVKGEDLATRVEMFLSGRAVYSLGALYPGHPPELFFDEPCRPPFLRNWHNHFDNYGNWIAGYCGGISLGRWRDLDELLERGVDPDRRPILGYLADQDFRGLLSLAEDLGYERSPDGYISKCHLCLDVRRHLSAQERFEELAPREFYSRVAEVSGRRGLQARAMC
jgi:hypothetical protein